MTRQRDADASRPAGIASISPVQIGIIAALIGLVALIVYAPRGDHAAPGRVVAESPEGDDARGAVTDGGELPFPMLREPRPAGREVPPAATVDGPPSPDEKKGVPIL